MVTEEVEKPVDEIVEEPVDLTLTTMYHKCDSHCSARATVRFVKVSTDQEMTYCGHHARKHYIMLGASGFHATTTGFIVYK